MQGATGRNALYEVKRYFYAALQWNCAIGGLMGLMVCNGISADLIDLTVPNARCVTHTVLKGQHPIAVAFVPKSAEVQKILMSLLS